MHQEESKQPSKSQALLNVIIELQKFVIEHDITSLELVNCANAVRANYLSAAASINQRDIRSSAYCDFCGCCGVESECTRFIQGRGNNYICSTCVERCSEVLSVKWLSDSESRGNRSYIDWNEMSKRGLLFRINHEILHPLGLAIEYSADSGASERVRVALDGIYTYSDDVMKKAKAQGWVKQSVSQNL